VAINADKALSTNDTEGVIQATGLGVSLTDPGSEDPAATKLTFVRGQGIIDPADIAADGARSKRDFPIPPPLSTHGPARVISVCNQKGGVGKTTTTINLGAAMAGYGRRVLMVDFDPQGALSVGLGVPIHDLKTTAFEVLMGNATAKEALIKTQVKGIDLLPSNIELSAAELYLVNEVGREYVLSRALAPIIDDYDVVLIDCQPSLGLLTLNALAASEGVLIPLECEYFALRGVALLIQTIQKVQERINPNLSIAGILPTMYDARTVHAREVLGRVEETFPDKLFETVITRTVKFPETTVAGMPITEYAPTSSAAGAYKRLAREVLTK
jgi:chromosome partitioning protein